MIGRALEIATKAHQGQKDKAGEEYIKHPMTIAASLGMEDPYAVMVALLHDVLEDSSVTKSSLMLYFPKKVVDAVVCLTRKPDEEYMDFIARCSQNELARKVKIVDLQHNMDLSRLPVVTETDRQRVQKKYIPALSYLMEHGAEK